MSLNSSLDSVFNRLPLLQMLSDSQVKSGDSLLRSRPNR